MATQYERERIRRVTKARRLLALVDAIDQTMVAVTQEVMEARERIEPDVVDARSIVRHDDEDRSRKALAENAQLVRQAQVRPWDKHLSAPIDCEASVPFPGRMIGWHRCQMKAVALIPLDEETAVCGTHRAYWVREGRLPYGVHHG